MVWEELVSPSISVVIPTYNRCATLIPVVESILHQTVPVLEVLVVDDGSHDETAERVAQLQREQPEWRERVRYFYQENQGQSAALNRGIAESQGEWLAFCAHDDLWLPWKIEWQLRALREAGPSCGLCFTDAWFMNNPYMKQTVFQFCAAHLQGSPLGTMPDAVERIATGRHPVWVQTVLARKDLVRHAGDFDPFLRYSEDHDFVFRMALVTDFCFVDLPLALIDRSPAMIRHTGPGENWHRAEYCLRMDKYRYEKQLDLSSDLPKRIQRILRKNLRGIHSHWATYHLEQGDFAQARSAMRLALVYDFTPQAALKAALIWAAPRLARAAFTAREQREGPRYDRTSWMTVRSGSK